MIIVTGAAGFIGSCLVGKLNAAGFNDIIVVDEFSHENKNRNLEGKIFSEKIERNQFQQWFKDNHRFVQFVFHIGARTDTTEFDRAIFDELNLNFSKDMSIDSPRWHVPKMQKFTSHPSEHVMEWRTRLLNTSF